MPTFSIARHSKIYPNLDFLGSNCAIWQPWSVVALNQLRRSLPKENLSLRSAILAFRADFSSSKLWSQQQGCQMVCFQTKNPNSGKFGRGIDW
jgi:hypothetical protein